MTKRKEIKTETIERRRAMAEIKRVLVSADGKIKVVFDSALNRQMMIFGGGDVYITLPEEITLRIMREEGYTNARDFIGDVAIVEGEHKVGDMEKAWSGCTYYDREKWTYKITDITTIKKENKEKEAPPRYHYARWAAFFLGIGMGIITSLIVHYII